MQKYWFKSRKTGYGFRPVTIEGWAVTVSLFVLILWAAFANGFFSGNITLANGFHFLFEMICFCAAFTLLFKGKVEGGLKWKRLNSGNKK